MRNRYKVDGDVLTIYLDRKDGSVLETRVNSWHLPKLMSLDVKWYAAKDKGTGAYYVMTRKKHKGVVECYQLHRFITDAPNGKVVDHRDHDTLNNLDYNLRVITKAENNQNIQKARKHNKIGIRGVTYAPNCPNNPYNARVSVNGKKVLNAYFPTIEQAEQAVKEARAKYQPYSKEGEDG